MSKGFLEWLDRKIEKYDAQWDILYAAVKNKGITTSDTTLFYNVSFKTSTTEAGGFVIDLTEKRYYRIAQVDDLSTLTVEYVGWFFNSFYRFRDFISEKWGSFKNKITATYGSIKR